MNRFILKKLTVSGGGHEDSILNFSNGLNLIIGPSNTGKSLIMDCIDYVFGFTPKKNKPSKIVDNNHGYTHVALTLQTENGDVTLKREIGQPKVKITSSNPAIKDDSYSVNHTAKKNLNDVLLKLIGIDDFHKILSSQKGDTQQLTWRSILHLFFMKQSDIDRESSALLAPGAMGYSSSAAALLYLLTNMDANEFQKAEDPTISKAKRNAVIMYIRDKKDQLSKRREELETLLTERDITDVQNIIQTIHSELESLQQELDGSTEKSRKLMSEIYQQNSKLSECNTVIHNFLSLSDQYQADIRRLEFIVDGQLAIPHQLSIRRCPFCDSELKEEPSEDYIAAASIELEKLKKHILELADAQSSANRKKLLIEEKISALESQKKQLDTFIETDLQPKISAFKNELQNYLRILQWRNELDVIRRDENQYKAELFEKENEEDSKEPKYDIKSSYEYDLVRGFEDILVATLKASKIGGAETARLNMQSFDIEIDNHSKPTCMGGGYCAILNALTVYSINTYIHERNGYAPGFFAIDSALTQLSEAAYVNKEDSVKYNFMSFLVSRALDRQVIMIEQKDEIPYVPTEDMQKGIHVIEFSRNPNYGRYGFLNDVVNPEHKK